MRTRSYQISFGIIIALTVMLLNLPSRTAARVKTVAGHFFLPLFGLKKGVEHTSGMIVDAGLPRSALLHEITMLHRTNDVLTMQLQQARGSTMENVRLRGQLELRSRPAAQMQLARVVGRDPANWWRTIQVDMGAESGVQIDQPVWVRDGLVGRVQHVGPKHAQVALLGDPSCRVSVKVRETGETAILAAGPFTTFDPSQVSLIFLPADTAAVPGHQIVTSGLSDIFPADIPVGTIVEVEKSHGSVQTTARVKLAVGSSRLSEVWIVMTKQP